jgi:hypothetical protein
VNRFCVSGLILLVLFTACSDDDPMSLPPPEEPEDSIWAGSTACRECHPSIASQHAVSGHVQHVRTVDSGTPPSWYWQDFIDNPVPGPPPGTSWQEVAVVVGGTNRTTVFVDASGELLTGPAARWDHEGAVWVQFFPGETLSFECSCHVTGHDAESGSWSEMGVGCEACHGPGREHSETEEPGDVAIDRSNALCEGCHAVSDDHPYPGTSPVGVVRDHFGERCVTCHDPHVSSRFNPDKGLRLDCPACHEPIAAG